MVKILHYANKQFEGQLSEHVAKSWTTSCPIPNGSDASISFHSHQLYPSTVLFCLCGCVCSFCVCGLFSFYFWGGEEGRGGGGWLVTMKMKNKTFCNGIYDYMECKWFSYIMSYEAWKRRLVSSFILNNPLLASLLLGYMDFSSPLTEHVLHRLL